MNLSEIKPGESMVAHIKSGRDRFGNPVPFGNVAVVVIWKDGGGHIREPIFTDFNMLNAKNPILLAGPGRRGSVTPPPPPPPGPGKPDFDLTGIQLDPEKPKAGETFTATLTVVNTGALEGDAGTLGLWLNRSEKVVQGVDGDTNLVVGVLQQSAFRSITIKELKAPDKPGNYVLRAFIDSKGITDEQSEANNQRTLPYTVK